MVAIALALAFLCAAVVAAFLPAPLRLGNWLPLHLALAGGATTAIAGMMPFFSAAFATTQPVDARVRWASVAAVALGALVVAVGYAAGTSPWRRPAARAFMAGIALTAYATIVPVRRPLARSGRRGDAGLRRGAAAWWPAGALLATLFLAGVMPVHAGLGQPATCARLAQPRGLRLPRHRHDAAALLPHRHRGAHPARPGAPTSPCWASPWGTALVALGFAARSDWLVAGWRPGRPGRGPGPGRLRCADLAHQVGLDGRRGLASLRHGRPDLGHRLVRGRGPGGHGPAHGRGCRPRGRQRHRLPRPDGPGLGRAWPCWLPRPTSCPAVGPGDPAAHARQRQLLGRLAVARLLAANARHRRPGAGHAHGQRRAPGGRHGADRASASARPLCSSWLRSPPGCAALARAATWWPEALSPPAPGTLSAPEARR